MSNKKLSFKELKLRARAARRRHSLKVAPQAKGVKNTWDKINKPAIDLLEAKVKSIQAQQAQQAS
jgi:hypothetical protein